MTIFSGSTPGQSMIEFLDMWLLDVEEAVIALRFENSFARSSILFLTNFRSKFVWIGALLSVLPIPHLVGQ